MVAKSSGIRHKTRNKLRLKQKPTINKMLEKFEIGEAVYLKICPSIHNFPHPKFGGRTGKVVAKRGKSYVVEISDLSKKKKIITEAVHLMRHSRKD